MHDDIKRFTLEGTIGAEQNVVESKERLVHFLEGSMRDEGYVPLLDMDPQYTRSYVLKEDWYEFQLSVYGVEVGEDKAWQIAGMMHGKTVERSTPPPKSKQS